MTEKKDKLEVLMQSKQLVHTSYNITALANRIFYYTLFSAQKEKNGVYTCTVKLSELQDLIHNRNKKSEKEVKLIFESLKRTSLLFEKKEEDDDIECDYVLIAATEYSPKKKEFKVFFLERLYNHIIGYSVYAPLNLNILTQFTSFYSQRLYELLRLWSRTGKEISKEFSVEELRFIFSAQDRYPAYKNFKQRVLSQAIKEINEYGNMKVDFEEIKEKRKTIKIKFNIFDNEPKVYFKNSDPKPIDENIVEENENDRIVEKEIEETSVVRATEVPDNNHYVQCPLDIFEDNYLKDFVEYCTNNMIIFSDENYNRILQESLDETYLKKGKILIGSTSNSYKYFFAIFSNKIHDYDQAISLEIESWL